MKGKMKLNVFPSIDNATPPLPSNFLTYKLPWWIACYLVRSFSDIAQCTSFISIKSRLVIIIFKERGIVIGVSVLFSEIFTILQRLRRSKFNFEHVLDFHK